MAVRVLTDTVIFSTAAIQFSPDTSHHCKQKENQEQVVLVFLIVEACLVDPLTSFPWAQQLHFLPGIFPKSFSNEEGHMWETHSRW